MRELTVQTGTADAAAWALPKTYMMHARERACTGNVSCIRWNLFNSSVNLTMKTATADWPCACMVSMHHCAVWARTPDNTHCCTARCSCCWVAWHRTRGSERATPTAESSSHCSAVSVMATTLHALLCCVKRESALVHASRPCPPVSACPLAVLPA